MTEAELARIESANRDVTRIATDIADVKSLHEEVRACWAAIHDLRQDNTGYRRAILDVLQLIKIHWQGERSGDDGRWLAVNIGVLVLTEDEFDSVWNK